jgi:hypothetical protein
MQQIVRESQERTLKSPRRTLKSPEIVETVSLKNVGLFPRQVNFTKYSTGNIKKQYAGDLENKDYFLIMKDKCEKAYQGCAKYFPNKNYKTLFEITTKPNWILQCFDGKKLDIGYPNFTKLNKVMMDNVSRKERLLDEFLVTDYSKTLESREFVDEDFYYIDANQTPDFFLILLTGKNSEQWNKLKNRK